jgi:hypothetical protein
MRGLGVLVEQRPAQPARAGLASAASDGVAGRRARARPSARRTAALPVAAAMTRVPVTLCPAVEGACAAAAHARGGVIARDARAGRARLGAALGLRRRVRDGAGQRKPVSGPAGRGPPRPIACGGPPRRPRGVALMSLPADRRRPPALAALFAVAAGWTGAALTADRCAGPPVPRDRLDVSRAGPV